MKRSNLCGMLVVVSVVVLSLAACAKPSVEMDPSLWSHKEYRIGVALIKHPDAAAHKAGAQGLLDMAINSAMAADLKTRMKTMKLDEFDTVRELFAAELQKRGMQAKIVETVIDPEQFAAFEAPSNVPKLYFDRNLKGLAEKESLDLIALLSVEGYGTLRKYYGFIPLGKPMGFCMASGQLVDLRTNELMWRSTASEEQSTVEVTGEWDQPPAYPELTDAVKKAIENSRAYIMQAFFGTTTAAEPRHDQTPDSAQLTQKQ